MSMARTVVLGAIEREQTEQDKAEAALACIKGAIEGFGQKIAKPLQDAVLYAGAQTSDTTMQHYHQLMKDLLEEMFQGEISELQDEIRHHDNEAGKIEEREASSAYLRGLGL